MGQRYSSLERGKSRKRRIYCIFYRSHIKKRKTRSDRKTSLAENVAETIGREIRDEYLEKPEGAEAKKYFVEQTGIKLHKIATGTMEAANGIAFPDGALQLSFDVKGPHEATLASLHAEKVTSSNKDKALLKQMIDNADINIPAEYLKRAHYSDLWTQESQDGVKDIWTQYFPKEFF